MFGKGARFNVIPTGRQGKNKCAVYSFTVLRTFTFRRSAVGGESSLGDGRGRTLWDTCWAYPDKEWLPLQTLESDTGQHGVTGLRASYPNGTKARMHARGRRYLCSWGWVVSSDRYGHIGEKESVTNVKAKMHKGIVVGITLKKT